MSRVNVSIDRLALSGFDPAARAAFEQGLRTELAAALADPAVQAQIYGRSSTVRSIPVLRLGKVVLQPGTSGARNLGRTVARAIGKSGAMSASERRPRG
jgi:hypothetical protein